MNDYVVKKLKEGRTRAKLKQSDVAAKLGLKGNTLSNYENGVSEPDIDTFCALCDIYQLDPSDILGEAYGLNVQGSNFNIKPSEIDHIKKYRDLDDHGKEMVDLVLEKEHARMTAAKVIPLPRPVEPPVTIAAHFEGDEFTEDELDEIREFAESVRNKGK